MSTRLARYCDRVIEAGWLAAAMLTPLYFNVYSARVFEPDKLVLLRCIALLMAAAWLVRTVEARSGVVVAPAGPRSRGELWRSLRAVPLVPQVLLLVLVYLLATVISVVPRASFWGSYQRLQGTYSTLAYIVIFFLTWEGLRTRAQLERLLNAIVLASLPIALYGVLQHYGLDPLPWAGDVTDRVTGTLGNAIFIAAYLMMAAFLTLERLVARFRRLLGGERSTLADAFMGATYAFILALQIVAIYFSKSRGPWLGLLAGAYAFMLIALVALRRSAAERGPLTHREAGKALGFALLSPLVGVIPAYVGLIVARRGRRWLWLSWCLQAVLALGFLVAFNLPQSPLAPLRQVAGIGRLGQVFETESGTGRVRVLIWQGSVELLRSNPLRALVGYGPESMFVAFNSAYPPDLAHYESRQASPDRSHNETFDALINTGLIGFAVYISLFVAIFYHGLRWLGFLPQAGGPPGPRRLFLGLTIGSAALGALVALAVDHSLRFAGVGVPVGLIAGVAVYLAIAAFRNPAEPISPTPLNPPATGGRWGVGNGRGSFAGRELLLTSLLALVVAHFVEIHFGIAIAATRLYFWLALALLLSAGTGRLSLEPAAVEAPAPQPVAMERGRRKGRREPRPAAPAVAPTARASLGAVAAGLLAALVLGTVLASFSTNTAASTNPFTILWGSLTQLQLADRSTAFAPGMLALVLLTWLLGAILVLGEAEARPDGKGSPALYAAVSLAGALPFALVYASRIQPQGDLGLIVFYYYAFALGAILLVAAFLPGPRPSGLPFCRRGWALLYPLLAGGVALMIASNASIVRADIYFKQAWDGMHRPVSEAVLARSIDAATAQRYYGAALAYYDQAVHYAPEEDYYLIFEGKALLEQVDLTGDSQVQQQYLQRAEQVLLRAQGLNPLNTDHVANLARLYRTWAGAVTDAAGRQAKLEEALRYYEQATRLSPHNATLFNEWGQALLDMGRPDDALARYQQSLAIDDRFAQTYLLLADYYLGRNDAAQAGSYAARAADVDPASMQVRSSVGYLYAQMGRVDEAIEEYLRVLAVYPSDYSTQKSLAILYGQAGQVDRALEVANAARAVVPESERAALEQLIAQLQAQVGQGAKP